MPLAVKPIASFDYSINGVKLNIHWPQLLNVYAVSLVSRLNQMILATKPEMVTASKSAEAVIGVSDLSSSVTRIYFNRGLEPHPWMNSIDVTFREEFCQSEGACKRLIDKKSAINVYHLDCKDTSKVMAESAINVKLTPSSGHMSGYCYPVICRYLDIRSRTAYSPYVSPGSSRIREGIVAKCQGNDNAQATLTCVNGVWLGNITAGDQIIDRCRSSAATTVNRSFIAALWTLIARSLLLSIADD